MENCPEKFDQKTLDDREVCGQVINKKRQECKNEGVRGRALAFSVNKEKAPYRGLFVF